MREKEIERAIGPVSRETLGALLDFETLVRKWNISINLVASATLPQLWERHILDSAQLLPLAPHALHWLDLGSGGGFPGMVVAILLKERRGARMTLVESNHKKASFLRTAIRKSAAPAEVRSVRIEDVELRLPPDVVTARALAPLPKLLHLSARWLAAGSTGLFHKGRDYAAEIEESRNMWDFDLIEHKSVVDSASVILEVRNLRKRQQEAHRLHDVGT